MKPRTTKWLLVISLAALVSGVYLMVAHAKGDADCPASRRAIVVVETTKHSLALCEHGKQAGTFTVRMGKNGTGKSHEGDGKTPVGRYGLGEPRASAAYGLFIPVEYPTPDQRKLGFTGGSVGVHGPDRRVRWLGALVNTFDTTDGCIGIATDREMKTVSDWVREHRAKEIVLH